MTKRDLTGVLVRMPPELKSRLADEVAERRSTMKDVAVAIRAERFGVPFEPSGRRSGAVGTSGAVLLRVPAELKRAVQTTAFERGTNTNRVIVEELSRTLGVRLEQTTTGRTFPLGGGRRKDDMAQTNGRNNGKARSRDKVRVAIIGVGNCANSLIQGVEFYKDADPSEFVPGLMHVDLGGYHVKDIEFSAAFDVTTDKVDKDLADAIWAHPNDTYRFADVPKTGVKVSRGMTHDGLGKYLSEIVEKAPGDTDDVVGILR